MTEHKTIDLFSALRNADCVLFAFDPEGVVILSEGGGLATIGRAPGESVGMSLFELYADSEAGLADIRRALTGESFSAMAEIRGRVYDTHFTPVLDSKGDLQHVVAISTDITDVTRDVRARAEMQDSLIESRQRFIDLAETAVGIVWEVDAEGRVTFVSPRLTQLTGREVSEAVGRIWTEIDWIEVSSEPQTLLRPDAGGPHAFAGINANVRHRDGRLLKFVGNGTPYFGKSGALKGYRGSASDVSEFEDVVFMLESVSQSVSTHIGEDFLRVVLGHLCRVTQADVAFVAKLEPEGLRATTVSVTVDGNVVDTMDFELKGTPCSVVLSSGDVRVYPSDVSRMFQGCPLIPLVDAEAFGGAPLFSSSGKIIGLLVLLKREPFDRPDLISTSLSVFAGRVGAELERQLTEVSLAESERRYRHLFDSSADAYLVFDAGGSVVEVNDFACTLYGYTAEEFVGLHGSQIVHPEFHHLFADFAATKEGEWFETVSKDVRKDGTVFDVEVHGTPIRLHGERHLLAIVRDVTERKAAEAALEESRRSMATLMDNLQGMVYRCKNDHDWTMEFVSDGCLELTGYSASELVGSAGIAFGSLIHPDDAESIRTEVQKALERKEPYALEYRITDRDGRERWLWEKGQGIYKADGLLALEGFITDMTQRKELEAALDARDHDVRRAYADVFHAATQGKLQFYTLEEVEASLGEVIGEAQELTEFSQLSASRQAVRDGIEAAFPCMESTGEVILAYGEAVTNGIKHGGSCTVTLRRAAATETEGKTLQVVVQDRGHGIDFSDLPRAALMPGFSTKNSLGMGFSIMLEVCDKVLLSTDEHGTTVVLVFECECAKESGTADGVSKSGIMSNT